MAATRAQHAIRAAPAARAPPLRVARRARGGRPGRAAAPRVVCAAARGEALEIEVLPKEEREGVMAAVEDLGYRVTAGDVAAAAGVPVHRAEEALKKLAADAGGALKVSNDGDLVYELPGSFRQALQSKSVRLRLEPLIERVSGGAMYVTRVSFGTALIASLVIVYMAIIAITTSRDSNDDRRGGGYYGGGGGMFMPYYSPFNSFSLFYDPYYYARPPRPPEEMNFLESVFSFVFGDGDPNEGVEETRFQLLGDMAAANGGTLVAEQIAPFADIESEDPTDESHVLPVLMRFNGETEISEDGNIVYRFPDLQVTAGGRSSEGVPVGTFLEEGEYGISQATAGQRMMAIGLGIANFVGVGILTVLLSDPETVARTAGSGIVLLASAALPFLQAYAVAYFVIPALRSVFAMQRNAAIQRRNLARIEAAKRLAEPDAELRRKLRDAAKGARRKTVSESQIIYGSDGSGGEKQRKMEEGIDDWERKFTEKYGES